MYFASHPNVEVIQNINLKSEPAMKFIDLFAGLGGFHTGFMNSGYECVFACELEPHLRELYLKNYGIEPQGDITKVDEKAIPAHDVMCAGFPCQPFSLAGKKKGAECPESGRLIDHVIRIAKYHQPKFIVLENVPNVISIAGGSFWSYLTTSFQDVGYQLYHKIISPKDIGIPQNRKRVFIVAVRSDLDQGEFEWPVSEKENDKNLLDLLDISSSNKKLEVKKQNLLAHWQTLLDQLNTQSFGAKSIVAPEFGATYPLEFESLTLDEIKQYKGAYGQSLACCETWQEVFERLPSYARKQRMVSNWLQKSVMFSRELYENNKKVCDRWSFNLDKNNNSWQILEWRGLQGVLDIYKHLVQFRASGIRILKPHVAPSLISMTPTQIPVIPTQNRYMSRYEAALLQNLQGLKYLPESNVSAFKALGNAVNAKVVELIASNLKVWKTA